MTSPYHNQSNGKVESAVKIVKSIIKKSQRDKRDLWLSIFDWHNTPTECINASPVQRLFSRRTKTVLPTTSDLLTPKIEKGENLTKLLNNKRKKAKYYYDRSSCSLRDLCINEIVCVQLLNSKHVWKLGKVLLQYTPRSYIVEVDGKLITRNGKFLRTTSESHIVLPAFDNFNFDDSSNCQDCKVNVSDPPMHNQSNEFTNVKCTRTRIIKPPTRFQDYVIN